MPILRPVPLLLALLLACGAALPPAWAADHGAAASGAEAGQGPAAVDGKAVTLPILVAPLVQDQRLTGYLYLTLRLTTATGGDADRLRDVLPLVQDTLLRALHRAPIPADEAENPETKAVLAKTVMSALAGLPEIRGVEGVAFAEYQSVLC